MFKKRFNEINAKQMELNVLYRTGLSDWVEEVWGTVWNRNFKQCRTLDFGKMIMECFKDVYVKQAELNVLYKKNTLWLGGRGLRYCIEL